MSFKGCRREMVMAVLRFLIPALEGWYQEVEIALL
jgi:hypothetical protein